MTNSVTPSRRASRESEVTAACLMAVSLLGSGGSRCFAQHLPADRAPVTSPAEHGSNARSIRDIDYSGTNNPRQMLDLYLPRRSAGDKPLPVVCWIHGGAWRSGGRDKPGASFIRDLVKTGEFAGVCIGYRLTNEARWPAQIHDCKAAVRWIRANAHHYDIDPGRIGVWGSSAGGHLVAMLGVTHPGDGLEGTVGPHRDIPSTVSCVVDYFGPTELLTMNQQGSVMDHDAPDSPESLLIGGPIQSHKQNAIHASPISYASKSDKPILIVHGTRDPLVPYQQSVAFKKKLQAVGVDAALITVDGGGHGGGFGPEIHRFARQFLEHHLLGTEHSFKDRTVPALAPETP